ncbi:MAG: hypothetical protein ACXACF_08455 [Candidatus Hermodarchaeia archaeon]|jgi:hypothetical protein
MTEEIIDEIRTIIAGFVRDELEKDYKDILSINGLWRFDVSKQGDGSICTIFEYVYDEDPWGDYRTQVIFQGSMYWDVQGKLQAKSMRLAELEYRATGPKRFLRKRMKSQEETLEEERRLLAWENSIRVGDLVEARYTANGNKFRYIGVITKINPKSFQVKTAELVLRVVLFEEEQAEEKTTTRPRRVSSKFSPNNGVFPLDINN